MTIEVFNRYEKKYILEEDTFEKLQSKLSEHMKLDAYNEKQKSYTISNLYYDAQDNYMIRSSLQKPKYKEKLRLRAYGVPESSTKVYVEIKKKVDGLVNKRRSALELDEAYAFLETGELPEYKAYQNRQVLNEISYILQMHELSPALYLAYDRIAYFGIDQHGLRVSFDNNIRTRRYGLSLEDGVYGSQLLDGRYRLMEIKTSQSIPIWLCRLLSEYEIYPSSFSKYGAEYQKMMKSTGMTYPVYEFAPQKAAKTRFSVVNA